MIKAPVKPKNTITPGALFLIATTLYLCGALMVGFGSHNSLTAIAGYVTGTLAWFHLGRMCGKLQGDK